MTTKWLVTPYFFDENDLALIGAVPHGSTYILNDVGSLSDRTASSLQRTHQPISQFVEDMVRHGSLPISISGDCCASLPVMAGMQKAGLDPIVVWLDAHPDFNTEASSQSGFLGGMPLAKMVGRGDLSLPDASGLISVAEHDCWLVGARDIDPPERDGLDASEVHEVDVKALETLTFDRPVHLHIDNDVIDARHVPANNFPVRNGPSLSEVIDACVAFATANHICAISLSGWNGKLDVDGATSEACQKLMGAIAIAATESRNFD